MAVPLIAKPHPKLKKYNRTSPYPIPLLDWHGETERRTLYKGYLSPVGVEIREKKDMETLFSRGFFGKGNLSKSAPTYDRSLPEGELCKMSMQKYERHLKVQKGNSFQHSDKHHVKEKVLVFESAEGVHIEMDEDGTILEDPCPAVEVLLLTFQEAFFLSYALGCLLVLHEDQYLSLKEMWKKFCEFSPGHQFPISYAVYHHFRSKGWVVKSGLKFGVNYILYKDGPPFNHASYSIVIQPVWQNSLQSCGNTRQMSWQQLFGLNRVNLNAGKELMICYVLCPESILSSEIEIPDIIKLLEIQEVLIHRWVASEGRMGNEEKSSGQT